MSVSLASAFRATGQFTTDPIDTSAGGTMRLDASATFDSVDATAAALVDFAIETSASDSGPWRVLAEKRLHRGATSERFSVSGVDAYSRIRGRFGGNGGVALTVSGDLL